jgi:hypothetical protein
MSYVSRMEKWIEQTRALMRGTVELDEELLRKWTASAPFLGLATREGKTLLVAIHEYVAAREAAVRLGGQFFRRAHEYEMVTLAQKISNIDNADLRLALLVEMRNHSHFVMPAELFLNSLPRIVRLPKPVLDEIDAGILRAVNDAVAALAEPFAPETRAFWSHYCSVVTPNYTQDWKDILERVRSFLKKPDAAGSFYTGHRNRIAGALFEAYGLRSPELAAEYADGMALAAKKAGVLGDGWQAFRTGNKLELTQLTPAQFAEMQRTGNFPDKVQWSQFADDSTAAVRFPKQVDTVGSATSGVGDIDFATLFQFKSVQDLEAFPIQNENDIARLLNPTLVFARIQGPKGQVICRVRQSLSHPGIDPLTLYRVATTDAPIPLSPLLKQLGVVQKSRALRPAREEIWDLADILASAAAGYNISP